MPTTLRWGVLSTAKIAREHLLPAMAASERAVVQAVASRDGARARELADRVGAPAAYGSYEDLLADPDVDAVYIPLPNHLHLPWATACAQAGKHVLCEKPLALDRAEAERMIEAATGAGVVLVEAFMYRTHPSWRRALDLVADGRIGELRAVQTWFSYFNDDPANIRNVPAYGGGALYDIGCYGIDSARLVLGGGTPGAAPDVVQGALRFDPVTGVDVLAAATLGFGDRLASFTAGIRTEPDQRVDLYGTAGRLRIEIPFNIPKDRPTRLLLTRGGQPPVAPHTEVIELEPADQYRCLVDAFAATVLDGAPPPVPHADSLATLAVIDEVFRQART